MDIKEWAAVESTMSGDAGPMVGTEISRRDDGPLTRRELERWAAAVGNHDLLCFDAEQARLHGYRDVIVPPLLLPMAVLGVVAASAANRELTREQLRELVLHLHFYAGWANGTGLQGVVEKLIAEQKKAERKKDQAKTDQQAQQ